MVLLAVLLLLASGIAFETGILGEVDSGNGVFYALSGNFIANQELSFALNMVSIMAIVSLTVMLNKAFSFVRAVTFSYASMFLLLEMANPLVCARFYTGTAMCLVMVVGMFVLFASYQQKGLSQRRIFLVFALLSFCCMFQYAFLVLLLAFMVGFFQMRAVDIRGILAMLIGIVTPFWIMIGLGITNPLTAQPPLIETIWSSLQLSQVKLVIATTIVVAVLTILLMIVNVFTFMNYRLQKRVYNTFIIVLALLSMGMMCIDYRNMMIYVPILNWCLAVQVAHAFTINSSLLRRYIPLVLLMMATMATYATHVIL